MKIAIADYPQLKLLCWNRPGAVTIDGDDAFSVYERNWRWIEQAKLTAKERQLIEELTCAHGHGVLLV